MWKQASIGFVFVIAAACCAGLPSSSSSCGDDEVEGPNGTCWPRCRSDQRWLGDRCSSPSGTWAQGPAAESCGEGAHLVTRDQMLSLLDRCTRDAEGDYRCYSCAASDTCGSMYDGTQGDVTVAYSNIWTSTPCTLPPPLSGQAAYLADLDDGTLTCFWADQSVGYPLCISD